MTHDQSLEAIKAAAQMVTKAVETGHLGVTSQDVAIRGDFIGKQFAAVYKAIKEAIEK